MNFQSHSAIGISSISNHSRDGSRPSSLARMSDFDWWSKTRLDALVRALRSRELSELGRPPPAKDDDFWKSVVNECQPASSSDGNSSDDEALSPSSLANDVKHEFESARYMETPAKGISVGDLGCAESRLVGLVRGIKGVVYVASHPMEPLWESDGIRYHTVVVSPAIEPSKTLASQLTAACDFLQNHRPALICSSSPSLPACVIAAYLYNPSPGKAPAHELLSRCAESLDLTEADLDENDRRGWRSLRHSSTTPLHHHAARPEASLWARTILRWRLRGEEASRAAADTPTKKRGAEEQAADEDESAARRSRRSRAPTASAAVKGCPRVAHAGEDDGRRGCPRSFRVRGLSRRVRRGRRVKGAAACARICARSRTLGQWAVRAGG